MKETNTSDIGVGGLLGVVFVTLKLCNVIDWSWGWVLVPFWAPFAVGLFFLAIAGVAWVFVKLLGK